MTLRSVLDAGVADGLFAGAVGLVGDRNGIHFLKAAGYAVADSSFMTTETVFDVASITKVLGATTGVIRAISQGRLNLTDSVARYLPAFRRPNLELIEVQHLLRHRAGLNEWQPLYLAATGRADVIELIADLPLRYPVDSGRHYSDLGLITLGAVLEEAVGELLPDYLRTTHEHLGLAHTSYGQIDSKNSDSDLAATSLGDSYEQQMVRSGSPYPIIIDAANAPPTGWRQQVLMGEVNDGNCFHALGGVSGHAGLFSTARDLWQWSTSLMTHAYPEAITGEFLRPTDAAHSLGFAALADLGAGLGVMHAGFTGTRVALFPQIGVSVVLLTNRLHPGPGAPNIEPAWTAFLDAAMALLDLNHG